MPAGNSACQNGRLAAGQYFRNLHRAGVPSSERSSTADERLPPETRAAAALLGAAATDSDATKAIYSCRFSCGLFVYTLVWFCMDPVGPDTLRAIYSCRLSYSLFVYALV